VGQAIRSLLSDLSNLTDGAEMYKVIVKSEKQAEPLRPLLGPNQQIVIKPAQQLTRSQRLMKRVRPWSVKTGDKRFRRWPEVPISDGFYEGIGCEVIHFMNQLDYVVSNLPTVYNPHDLQHLHYPQFWSAAEIAQREVVYRAGCQLARTVVVGSQWIKDDLVKQYQIDPHKVQVIPEGPPTQSIAAPSTQEQAAVLKKFELQQPFAIYPAVTWEHKNHIRLLEALAHLRDVRGLNIRLVCTGSQYSFWPQIKRRISELNLEPQIKFLGFVTEPDLRALYRLSQFLVMPTLFEAISLPIFEAWLEGVPVTCSDATALPEQVLDAALKFDPESIQSIANAVEQLAVNEKLRAELRTRGAQRLLDFDCERTARAYRAVYRRAARRPLSEDDRHLLNWNWMQRPIPELAVN
jgi:glycosyltransferase involved in cell wall biosynthesis